MVEKSENSLEATIKAYRYITSHMASPSENSILQKNTLKVDEESKLINFFFKMEIVQHY